MFGELESLVVLILGDAESTTRAADPIKCPAITRLFLPARNAFSLFHFHMVIVTSLNLDRDESEVWENNEVPATTLPTFFNDDLSIGPK